MAPPRKYLTIEEFTTFLSNHFEHLRLDVKWLKWAVGLGLGGTIALLATTLGIVIANS